MNDKRILDGPTMIDADTVSRNLTYDVCIPLVRDAMIALSAGHTKQLPRGTIALGNGQFFGIMPGSLSSQGYFGAKLVSVFDDPERPGRSAHRGVVVLFEGNTGRAVCVADAEQITLVRTASASAVASEVLARPQASVLGIIGCGQQAEAHIRAISQIREIRRVKMWGRSPERLALAARRISHSAGIEVQQMIDVESVVSSSDIVCTITAATDPILFGSYVKPGTHVNLIGASDAAAAECDSELVQRARYYVDSRTSALAQAGELLRAKAACLVDDNHIIAEIGEVLLGSRQSRMASDDITVYKSLGHAVQDLAAAVYLYEHSRKATLN